MHISDHSQWKLSLVKLFKCVCVVVNVWWLYLERHVAVEAFLADFRTVFPRDFYGHKSADMEIFIMAQDIMSLNSIIDLLLCNTAFYQRNFVANFA